MVCMRRLMTVAIMCETSPNSSSSVGTPCGEGSVQHNTWKERGGLVALSRFFPTFLRFCDFFPFSKLLGAQCSSSTNGRAVATFLKFCTILRFFPFSKRLGAQCSLATNGRAVTIFLNFFAIL